MESGAVSALQGVLNSQYNLLINVPVAVATAMSASVVPGIAALRAMGREEEVHRKTASVIKINMLIAFPSMAGLLWYSELGVYAVMIGNILFPLLISLLNVRSLAVHLRYRPELRSSFLLPFGCSAIMGAAVFLVYRGVDTLLGANTPAVLAAIVSGGLIYLFLIGKLHCLTEKEMRERELHLKK